VSTSVVRESTRKRELRDAAYDYVLRHGLSGLSLRPLAAAIGSSPRVLVYLFGSKEGLIAELLARAREDELGALRELDPTPRDTMSVALALWDWLADPRRRGLLRLWVEAYGRSLVEPAGPWAGFAGGSVRALLDVLNPAGTRSSGDSEIRRTAILALLRGAMLDLLATGDDDRVGAAVHSALARLPS
jgi:AcrR family transcriptional regulator